MGAPFVYIIRMDRVTDNANPPPELIKVGYTTQKLDDRRIELNTGNPYKLEYVAAWRVVDGQEGEKVAHYHLSQEGLKAKPDYGGGREWFRLPLNKYAGAQTLIQTALQQKGMLHDDKSKNYVSKEI